MGIMVHLDAIAYGPVFSKLNHFSESVGIQKYITWHSGLSGEFYVYKFAKLLKTSDLFVFAPTIASNGDVEVGPSISDIHAQAVGVLVVSTPYPGMEISITNNLTAFFCQGDSVSEISNHVLKYIQDKEFYLSVGRAGIDKVKKSLL